MVVLPDPEAGTQAGYYDTLSRGQVVLTFAEILDLQTVPTESSDASIDVEAVPDTSLIEVSAVAPEPDVAEMAADSVLEASRLYFGQLASPYEIYLVRQAEGTAERTGPAVGPLLAVTPVVALIAGLATQQAVHALTSASRVPVLGSASGAMGRPPAEARAQTPPEQAEAPEPPPEEGRSAAQAGRSRDGRRSGSSADAEVTSRSEGGSSRRVAERSAGSGVLEESPEPMAPRYRR